MLATLIGGKSRTKSASVEERFFFPFDYARSASGQIVTAETAQRVSAVFACIRVLAETLASAPCITYRRRAGGGKDRASNLPIYQVLHDYPNQWQTAFEFWEMAMSHLALRGNFYAVIVPGLRGAASELVPMHPDRMKVERTESGKLRYIFTDPETSAQQPYTQDEIFHIRGMSCDGLTGVSIIQYARETIGSALATDKYTAGFFKNDATPGMVLGTDQALDAAARQETARQWNLRHAGSDNAHRTAVLSHGLKPITLGVSQRDSQFVESKRLNRSEIASLFRVPQHLIGEMSQATFSNIEQQSLEFVQYTMLPWFRRIEAAIQRDLITEENVFAEFLIDGLLRGDIQARYNAYAIGRNNGWLNANEIREKENMNDIGEQGDVYLVQGAMITLDRAISPPEPPPAPIPPVPEPGSQTEDGTSTEEQPPQDLRAILEIVVAAKDGEIEANRQAAIAERERAQELADRLQSEAARFEESLREKSALEAERIRVQAALAETVRERDAKQAEAEQAVAAAAEHAARMGEVLGRLKQLAADELRGLIRVEVNAMQRASHKHDFLGAIDKFYGEHRQRIEESMRLPLQLLETTGGTKHDPELLAEAHCDESLNAMLVAAGECTADTLPEAISQLMADWEQRAAFLEN